MQKLIYVVEDETSLREVLLLILEGENYKVETFAVIAAFWKAIEVEIPDLILSNIMLPDGDGRELCKLVKADTRIKHIPMILMSALVRERSIPDDICFDDFISKPFDIDLVMAKVKEHIG